MLGALVKKVFFFFKHKCYPTGAGTQIHPPLDLGRIRWKQNCRDHRELRMRTGCLGAADVFLWDYQLHNVCDLYFFWFTILIDVTNLRHVIVCYIKHNSRLNLLSVYIILWLFINKTFFFKLYSNLSAMKEVTIVSVILYHLL